MKLERIDHLVLTVRDIPDTCAFYTHVLGMREVSFGAARKALAFGHQKINLHAQDAKLEPRAARPTPGSADLCLVTSTPIPAVLAHLQSCGVSVELGPVGRTGALGPITSVYIRDPDANLIEIASYG